MPTSGGQLTGQAGHQALAFWYKQKKKDEKARKAALDIAWKVFVDNPELVGDDTQEKFGVIERALGRYFDWAEKEDKKWEVLAAEYEFKVGIGKHPLIGFIDLIIRTNNQIWLVEHKFNKQASVAHLDLDPQVSTYLLAATIAGYQPIGVVYNIIRTTDGPTAQKQPVLRTMVYRNPEGLQAKAKEMNNQMSEMADFLENGGSIYRNETHDCHWDCTYYNVCLSITDNGSPEEVLDKMDKRQTGYGEEYDES